MTGIAVPVGGGPNEIRATSILTQEWRFNEMLVILRTVQIAGLAVAAWMWIGQILATAGKANGIWSWFRFREYGETADEQF